METNNINAYGNPNAIGRPSLMEMYLKGEALDASLKRDLAKTNYLDIRDRKHKKTKRGRRKG
jgi:hypothetical protein